MTRLRWMLLLAALVLAAAALAGVAAPRLGRAAGASPGTITVTGEGSATATPDVASFDFSVDARAAAASAAFAKVAAAEQAVIAAVEKVPVADADIQTSEVSLSPTTSQNGSITGYAASTTISVETTVAKAGALVDAAVAAGATGISGPNLTNSDQRTLYRQALVKAVADADAKAKALAEAASLTLGPAQTIVEGSTQTPILNAPAASTPTVRIEPGTQTIDATVTVTYGTA